MRMANQPIDLPLCVNLKLSRHERSNENILEVYFNGLPTNIEESYNGSATFLQGNGTSGDMNSSISTTLLRPINLHHVDSLISNPGYQTLSAFSLLGNLIMISVILFMPQFRKPANYLIVNLSLSSILFIISTNLRLAENAYEIWDYNTFRCRFLAVIHRIPIPCVALTTMIISLDRGRVARNPMNCSSFTPAWKIIFIWGFSLLIVLPLAFTRVHDECIPSAYKCAKVLLLEQPILSMLYGIIYLMSIHVIPAAILVRESIKTQRIMRFLKLSRSQPMECSVGIIPYSTSSLSDNRMRLLRNSCLFTIIFLVCWLPYGIFQFPLDLPKEIIPDVLEIYVRFYFRFIRNFTYMQIALNPVILFALSYDLRMYLTRVQSDWRVRINFHNYNTRYNSHNRLRSNHILRLRQQVP